MAYNVTIKVFGASFDAHHTSNTAEIFKDVGLRDALDNKTITGMLYGINKCIKQVENCKDYYKQREPDSKWGTVETSIDFMKSMRNFLLDNLFLVTTTFSSSNIAVAEVFN